MILAAGLLVLIGLALFVAGVATGVTLLYWLCVAVCVAAGVFLLLARRKMTAAAGSGQASEPGPLSAGAATADHAATGAAPGAARAARPVTTGPATDAPASPPAAEPVTAPPSGDGRVDAVPAGPAAPAGANAPAGSRAPAEPAAPAGATAAGALHAHRGAPPADEHHIPGEPPLEEVEVTDLLLVVDLRDEVLVVDEHPRYHLAGCRWLSGRETIPLPIDEARTDGFTPCGICEPDRHLADRERSRRSGR